MHIGICQVFDHFTKEIISLFKLHGESGVWALSITAKPKQDCDG